MAVVCTDLILIAAWWLIQPLALYSFSRFTGDSVFISRYLSLALPGTALMATALAAKYLYHGVAHEFGRVGCGGVISNGQLEYAGIAP